MSWPVRCNNFFLKNGSPRTTCSAFNNRCLLRWCVTHQRQQIAPWGFGIFCDIFRCFIGWEYRISVGDTQSNCGPIGAVGKGHGFTRCFEAPELLPKKHPLGDAKNGSLPLPQFCCFFSLEITTKKKEEVCWHILWSKGCKNCDLHRLVLAISTLIV